MKKVLIAAVIFVMSTAILACGEEKESKVSQNESSELKETKKDLPDGDYTDMGQGTMYISTTGGTSENGEVPVIFSEKNTALIQISICTEGIDGKKISYIYIDRLIADKSQVTDSAGSLNLEKDSLKKGVHDVELVQYDDNTESGKMVTYKSAQYEVKDISDFDKSTEDTVSEQSTDDDVEFDKNLLSIEITIPASFYEGMGTVPTQEQLDQESEDGMKATLNADSSVTIKMSKSVYKQKMKEMSDSMQAEIDKILNDKETYPSIMDITANDDFSEFVISSSCKAKSELSMEESMIDFSLQIAAMGYHMFMENPPGDAVVNWNNAESGQKLE